MTCQCAICLSSQDDQWITLTTCGHLFHRGCIQYCENNECPICRTEYNIDNIIRIKLNEEKEGICCEEGYIIRNSISIIKRSIGAWLFL